MENYVFGLMRDYLYTMSASWECWDGSFILSSKQYQGISFLDFYEKEMKDALHLAKSTLENHKSTFILLKRFAPNLRFSDITYTFLCNFEKYLLTLRYNQNTIAKHMRHIKRYVNQAYYAGLMDNKDLFGQYRIKEVAKPRYSLMPDELKRIEDLDVSHFKQGMACSRDMFLFSCYTGLRYSDVTRLTVDNFQLIHGKWWLFCKMVKTGEYVRLPLYLLFGGKTIPIFLKYSQNDNLFSAMKNSNSNVNKHLKIIAKMAHINKWVTFHLARHTHATLLLYLGANITTVQRLLGHKNVHTTQIYGRVMEETVVRDLKRLLKYDPVPFG